MPIHLTNKARAIQAVRARPGIGVAGLSEALGLDKGTVRKAALEAAKEGRISAQNDGQGYAFYPADIVGRELGPPPQHDRRAPTYDSAHTASPQVVEGQFKEIPAASSASRALVPAGQPYDSRTEAAVRQHAAARTRQQSPQGHTMSVQGGAALNALFAHDPDGTAAIASFHQAAEARLAAQTAHEQWAREQYARQERERREALTRDKEKADRAEMHSVIQQMLGIGRDREDDDDKPPSFAEQERRAREQRRLDGEEENERRYQEAVRQQERLAAELYEDDEGRVRVGYSAPEEDAEPEAPAPFTSKMGSKVPAPAPMRPTSSPVEHLLAKARARTSPNNGARPPGSNSDKSWKEWLAARFSTPSKSVFR